jgi:hypothetical protein
MARGHFYLGGGTAVQKATGQDDTPEFRYLTAVSRDPEKDKIRAYCEGSPEHWTGWRRSASSANGPATRRRR